MSRRLVVALVVSAALLAAACGTSATSTGVAAIEPRNGKSGLHLAGTVSGRHIAVNDGAPVLRLGDCDVNDGADTDLCFFSSEVDGGFFAVIIENPDVVVPGTVVVVDPSCQSPRCNMISDGAVVELQFAAGADRVRATGGRLSVEVVEEAQRYGGTLNLLLPDGRISGTFEVVPRPEEPS